MLRAPALSIVLIVAVSLHVSLQADEIAGTLEARAIAALPLPTIDVLLDDWTNDRACRTYDSKVHQFLYDDTFERYEKFTVGRLLYQRDGESHWEIEPGCSHLWRKDVRLFIQRDRGCYWEAKVSEIEAKREKLQTAIPDETGFFTWLKRAFFSAIPAEPNDAIPYLLMTDSKRLRDRYDLTLHRHRRDVMLVGIAKEPSEHQPRYVDFLFRRGEALPYAVRRSEINSRDYRIYHLIDPRIDVLPDDAESFLHPDLTGLEKR